MSLRESNMWEQRKNSKSQCPRPCMELPQRYPLMVWRHKSLSFCLGPVWNDCNTKIVCFFMDIYCCIMILELIIHKCKGRVGLQLQRHLNLILQGIELKCLNWVLREWFRSPQTKWTNRHCFLGMLQIFGHFTWEKLNHRWLS